MHITIYSNIHAKHNNQAALPPCNEYLAIFISLLKGIISYLLNDKNDWVIHLYFDVVFDLFVSNMTHECGFFDTSTLDL